MAFTALMLLWWVTFSVTCIFFYCLLYRSTKLKRLLPFMLSTKTRWLGLIFKKIIFYGIGLGQVKPGHGGEWCKDGSRYVLLLYHVILISIYTRVPFFSRYKGGYICNRQITFCQVCFVFKNYGTITWFNTGQWWLKSSRIFVNSLTPGISSRYQNPIPNQKYLLMIC